ncbi:Ribosomal protein S7e family protein [Hibiscus syriacus]|uniref:Ribosomal protein S7e family protein n=1 Tax=Hibiscus syriacus TaxID=106335 RepID=A0A6A2ZLB8_HIBSY|nr:putative E3 ubiquitin-protein ligase RF298 [Hibiscus syriacus]XP_039013855.1 putative E3 ubiquitin-protein ligase RF298 [Hibiscus syriacus]XP_039013856.1 putative E3 ubiquitin-protein ligase RF298 [Hibiscus syriacus]KAE8692099.1 Ribosomal protein S7e family protein [Hibiscus syriacus]
MDEKIDNGGAAASKLESSSVVPSDKGSKNKRKLDDNPSLENPDSAPLSMSEFSPKIFQSPTVGPLEVGSSLREDSQPTDWDDPIACQLAELLSSNMLTIFQNAIKRIVECGYEEAVAKKVISGRGLYQGGKNLVSNVANDALASLKKGKGEDISNYVFEDFQKLVEYTMLEMISVLREVKPSLSIAEAMWWLLMFDLNISMACEVGDIFCNVGCKEILGESSSDSIAQLRPESQNPETILPCPNGHHVLKPSLHCCKHYLPETLKFGSLANLTNCKGAAVAYEALTPEKDSLAYVGASRDPVTSIPGRKPGSCRKGCSKKELAALRKKSFNIEKCKVACGKCAFRSGKMATIGGLVVERRIKSPSELSVMHMKNASLRRINEPGDLVHQCHHVLTNSSHGLCVPDNSSVLLVNGTKSALPTADTGLASSSSSENKPVHKSEDRTSKSSTTPDNGAERKPTPKAKAITSTSSKSTDYFAGIPYDKSLGKYIPQDEKDQLVLKLVPRLEELQNELHSWSQWASQKVKQAVCRLNKDQDEIKSLRQEMEEAEQLKRKKKIMEENTMKRLFEMESALDNATNQVEDAHSKLQKLEVEHSVLKMEMEVAKLHSATTASSCLEALEREQKVIKEVRSWDTQRGLLQEELASEKKKIAELQRKLGKAKRIYNQTMMLWKQERMAMEKFLAQAASIRKESECLEAAEKIEEDKIKMKAENDMQKYGEEIKRLENKLSELKMNLDSSKISALWRGTDGGNGQCSSVKEGHLPIFSKRVININDYPRSRGLKRERECVMCLTEEKIVVFLPCSHQVFCVKCSELHHKQRMKDCPACRAPIICRIRARFAESLAIAH